MARLAAGSYWFDSSRRSPPAGEKLLTFSSPVGDRYVAVSAAPRLSSVEIASLPGMTLDLRTLFGE